MAKAGREYNELVTSIARALEPEAKVEQSQWIEGPDGKREVDVEVRGVVDGRDHFILIECKDWKVPVDIQEIDKLDSKRRDLAADAAIICSNAGFTKKALLKAERVGIDAVSAISKGNKLVRGILNRKRIIKVLSVESCQITLYPSQESDQNFPEPWDYRTLRYEGLPFTNWLTKLSMNLLKQYEGEPKITYTAALKHETPFTLEGVSVVLRGFRAEIWCRRKWMSQTLREDVSLGVYNHITKRLTIPDKQYWWLGELDSHLEGWEEMDIDGEPEEWTKPLESGRIRLNLTLLNAIPGIEDEGMPAIDDLISESRTDLR